MNLNRCLDPHQPQRLASPVCFEETQFAWTGLSQVGQSSEYMGESITCAQTAQGLPTRTNILPPLGNKSQAVIVLPLFHALPPSNVVITTVLPATVKDLTPFPRQTTPARPRTSDEADQCCVAMHRPVSRSRPGPPITAPAFPPVVSPSTTATPFSAECLSFWVGRVRVGSPTWDAEDFRGGIRCTQCKGRRLSLEVCRVVPSLPGVNRLLPGVE